MKQMCMAACAAGAIICAMAFKPAPKSQIKADDCQYGHCGFIKKNGYQCGNCAQKGSYYCWSHNHQ